MITPMVMTPSLHRLRAAALIAVLVGGAVSVAFTVRAGRHTPRLLLAIFVVWVLSPFVILFVSIVSRAWSQLVQASLYIAALVLSLASLAVYGYEAFGAAQPKTAVFVLMPPASWLLIVVVLSTAAILSRHVARR